MALTIADAFKVAFINYEKGKVEECHLGSRLAQYDNKETYQQAEAVVNKGFVETDTNPKTTSADLLNAPIIQVTAEGASSLTAEEDLAKNMQALVKYPFLLHVPTTLVRDMFLLLILCVSVKTTVNNSD